ncbi:MAG TPA: hypothetical protein ACFE0H_03300 [Elainellaceae cyanobacterium]
MSITDNQIQALNNVSDLQELSDENAATVQGGVADLFRHHTPHPNNERLGRFHGGGLRRLSSNADNQISSIWISGGEKWKFYLKPNWIDIPGVRDSFVLDRTRSRYGKWYNLTWSNDKISSFRRIG